ncbi:hypothetical protein P170DRAFT_257446 [Aspergillus steynii IBT 23096]|uniref:Uncharacterized protein n=1 Tax=Aspergillus steynii IBT 23096 TaxID=1392250 RepID=A0A2I2FZ92_9EURO|nr:uncharacterized protein P170DRAFT_257446 [Aspergillus steynii IBT 23096]PLB45959.1 hypothetical protein P170DRAFT_257446 [Aspergillus steynii IBT 23096]
MEQHMTAIRRCHSLASGHPADCLTVSSRRVGISQVLFAIHTGERPADPHSRVLPRDDWQRRHHGYLPLPLTVGVRHADPKISDVGVLSHRLGAAESTGPKSAGKCVRCLARNWEFRGGRFWESGKGIESGIPALCARIRSWPLSRRNAGVNTRGEMRSRKEGPGV